MVCTCPTIHLVIWETTTAIDGAYAGSGGTIDKARVVGKVASRGTVPGGAPGGRSPGRLVPGVLRQGRMGALVPSGVRGLLAPPGAGRELAWAPVVGVLLGPQARPHPDSIKRGGGGAGRHVISTVRFLGRALTRRTRIGASHPLREGVQLRELSTMDTEGWYVHARPPARPCGNLSPP